MKLVNTKNNAIIQTDLFFTLRKLMKIRLMENFALQLYKETLHVEIETTIKNLYSDDEVLMFVRNVNL